jgi:hypothetical protein
VTARMRSIGIVDSKCSASDLRTVRSRRARGVRSLSAASVMPVIRAKSPTTRTLAPLASSTFTALLGWITGSGRTPSRGSAATESRSQVCSCSVISIAIPCTPSYTDGSLSKHRADNVIRGLLSRTRQPEYFLSPPCSVCTPDTNTTKCDAVVSKPRSMFVETYPRRAREPAAPTPMIAHPRATSARSRVTPRTP